MSETPRIETLQIGPDLTIALHPDGTATYSTEDGTEREVLIAVMRARIQRKMTVDLLERWMKAWGEPVASSFEEES